MESSPPHLDDFEIKRDLGGDACSNDVQLAEMGDGTPVVLKKIEKENIEPNFIKSEVNAGQTLDHSGIVHFREYFEDTKYAYLVFDYIDGDDLFSFMDKRDWKPLPRDEARK